MIFSFHSSLPVLDRREKGLLLAVFLMLLAALMGPALLQPAHYHDFADQRSWGGLPHAMDVLSNLPFAVWGLVGFWVLARAHGEQNLDRASSALSGLFFAGLMVTALVSSYYHWMPDDHGLSWDRAGMVLAFAGVLGLAAARGVSPRAGVWLAAGVGALGLASVQVWAASGNVLPWAVLQFGGMALIVVLACLPKEKGARGLDIRWGVLIGLYAAAKVLELSDHQVFELTNHWVSGHSLKHAVASFAAWPLVCALRSDQKASLEATRKII